MRRRLVAPFLFVALAAIVSPTQAPQAIAQGNDPIEETFQTADGLQLHGLFTKSQKNGGNDPVVILLYPPGKGNDMGKGDWKGLATLLSKEGYNVLQFDWRGHGKSTTIKDPARFWNLPAGMGNPDPNPFTGSWNSARLITGAPNLMGKGKIKNDLFFKDLKDPVKYAPTYLLDLAAARHHLDTKNDAGDLNTSSIYLIGSDISATIGLAWLTTEWNRPAFNPTANQLAVPFGTPGGFPTYRYVPQPLSGGLPNELGGGDISGAVWLSAAKSPSVPDVLLKNWIAKGAPKLRENNPMLFLYAPKDTKAKTASEFFADGVLVAKPPAGSPLSKLDQTQALEVKEGGALNGVALLGANAGTEKTILQYLEALQKNRAKLIRKNRGFTAPWSIQLAPDNNLAGQGFGLVRP